MKPIAQQHRLCSQHRYNVHKSWEKVDIRNRTSPVKKLRYPLFIFVSSPKISVTGARLVYKMLRCRPPTLSPTLRRAKKLANNCIEGIKSKKLELRFIYPQPVGVVVIVASHFISKQSRPIPSRPGRREQYPQQRKNVGRPQKEFTRNMHSVACI
jgi:hypothetical protein